VEGYHVQKVAVFDFGVSYAWQLFLGCPFSMVGFCRLFYFPQHDKTVNYIGLDSTTY
jgi:hypothetical protein